MEQRQTLRIDNLKEGIIICTEKNVRKFYIDGYNLLREYHNNDPRELKLCLEKIIIESSYPRERQKCLEALNVLYPEKTRSNQEHMNQNRSNQETSNNEWLRLTLNEHFTKKESGEKFYLIINRNNFIHKKNFASIIKKIFENMKTSGLTSIYEKENFSMIKKKEYYDNCSNKKKTFSKIKGTFYYYRTTSRKELFYSLSILFKHKLIPFSVYIEFKPSVEKRRRFQLQHPKIAYQYDP